MKNKKSAPASMMLPKELTTVTPFSRAVAMVVVIVIPIIAFLFGMRYQQILTSETVTMQPAPMLVHMKSVPAVTPKPTPAPMMRRWK